MPDARQKQSELDTLTLPDDTGNSIRVDPKRSRLSCSSCSYIHEKNAGDLAFVVPTQGHESK
jgi:hypothetical protein